MFTIRSGAKPMRGSSSSPGPEAWCGTTQSMSPTASPRSAEHDAPPVAPGRPTLGACCLSVLSKRFGSDCYSAPGDKFRRQDSAARCGSRTSEGRDLSVVDGRGQVLITTSALPSDHGTENQCGASPERRATTLRRCIRQVETACAPPPCNDCRRRVRYRPP
jgi:hypothetical protein